MKIYLLRHGEADWPDWEGPDDDRPLTRKGKKEMRKVAKFFSDLKIKPAAILSSPLSRAYQTAELVADELDMNVEQDKELGPGFSADKFAALCKEFANRDLMIVGHEPDLSTIIGAVIGGASVKMAKAGLARVDIDDPNESKGLLVWLIPPKISAG